MRELLIVNRELVGGPGSSIDIPKIGGLDAVVMTDENDDLSPQILPVDKITVNLERIEATVDLSRDLIQRSYIDIMDEATKALGKALAKKEDVKLIETAIAGAGHVIRVNDRATDNDITATDVLDTDTIKKAITTLEANDAPGPYWVVIHPNQKGALYKDEQFVDASKYGSDRVRATGEIGEFLGARVVATTNIPHAPNTNTVEVYSGLVLSERSLVDVIGEEVVVIESDLIPAGKLGTRLVATMAIGAGVLNPTYTAVIKSA